VPIPVERIRQYSRVVDSASEANSNRGCVQMTLGSFLVGLAAVLWLGAGLNKTGTGVLEPFLALIGVAALAVGIIRRVMWVRGSD
jgi:lipopolysaccharide export LptBFGC system permease protein LptF